MFEIKRKLDVKAEDFFEKLSDSLVFDITAATGKNVRVNQISEGYKYTKKLKTKTGKSGNVKVTITKFEAPKVYASTFTSAQGDNFISYEINKLSDEQIEVVYTEDYKGTSNAKDLNAKVMQFLYKRGNKKRINKLLTKMEAFILNEYEEKEMLAEEQNIKDQASE
ncbi:MAG: DUF3284 domain-containing protein [Erysipelotrichaceae bacterium]